MSRDMSKSFLPFLFPTGGNAQAMHGQVVALTDSSNHLRDLQRKLRLVQRQAVQLPVYNPVPPRLGDDRTVFGTFTKTRKSYVAPVQTNRMYSEVYPIPNPPFHSFVPGRSSRLVGRDQTVATR